MKYTSTRSSVHLYTFEEALCSGYAPDGGLFVPERLPDKISPSILQEWSKLNYIDLATSILSLFLSPEEIPLKDLCHVIQVSLSSFDSQVVPVVRKNAPNPIFVVELFHGATFCFKDLSLQFVIQMLNYFAVKRNRKVTLVVATTGDTGPAAVQAVEDCKSDHLGILVHYPEGQISDFQRKQLTTCTHEKIRVVAFQGGGDDMDAPIKNIMTDPTSQSEERFISGVNSYNIARPLMQMVHFVWAYLRVAESLGIQAGDPDFQLDVMLPTGAMGNMAGGYIAKKMGVPIGRMCAGVNINDITHQAFSRGVVQRSPIMHSTMSEAINIQLPYNLERLLFYLSDQNHEQVKLWYQQLETGVDHTMKLHNTSWFAKLQKEFGSARVTDDELCETLREVRSKLDYYADPNTGVAFCAAKKLGYCFQSEEAEKEVGKEKSNLAIFATASPCKFESVITTALGKDEWDNYVSNHFPIRGTDVLSKAERPLVRYLAGEGKTLQENQVHWEAMARKLIQDL